MSKANAKPGKRLVLNPMVKLGLDLGPLVLFFFANSYGGIFFATGALMVATIAALGVTYWLIRRISIVPLATAGILLSFGALTIWLQDESFIKIKPTLIYVMFASILIAGLATGRPLFEYVLDGAFHMTHEGWKKLTWRWAFFFLAMALANEFVWRTFSTDVWVAVKTFAVIPVTLLFALAQAPLMMRYKGEKAEPTGS
ncbi:MAG TPA: septation protein A [Xanthobacteraceae bacterium]|nr:septation protein A [Xanthobacteraceae bacterium]